MVPLGLLLSLSLFAQGAALSLHNDPDASEDLLAQVLPGNTLNPGKYYFLRAVNNFSLNKKREATYWCHLVLETWEPVPVRYQELAALMLSDMADWTDRKTDDLDDIGRDMNTIKSRLFHSKGGPRTQSLQDDVIARLDKKIKQLEDDANSVSSSTASKKRDSPYLPKPMLDSFRGEDDNKGPGTVAPLKFKESKDNWGSLPEKERAKVSLELIRELPAKHRELVEEYLRRLSREIK